MTTPIPRLPIYGSVLVLVAMVSWHQPALAQSYFDAPSERTGNNATLIIPTSAVTVNNVQVLEPGDEIAVFSEAGACVGASVWTGENVAITIWGNNELTGEVDGLRMDEPFNLRIWRPALEEELTPDDGQIEMALSSRHAYYRSDATYAPNAIYVVERLRIDPSEASDVTSR